MTHIHWFRFYRLFLRCIGVFLVSHYCDVFMRFRGFWDDYDGMKERWIFGGMDFVSRYYFCSKAGLRRHSLYETRVF